MVFLRIAHVLTMYLMANEPAFRAALEEKVPAISQVPVITIPFVREYNQQVWGYIIADFPGNYITWLETYVADPKYDTIKQECWNAYENSTHRVGITTPVTAQMSTYGPPLWKELHTYAATWDGDVAKARRFLEVFKVKIPCGTCKLGWNDILQTIPPILTDREAFFEWTVDAHNKVNHKLSKPEVNLREAKFIHKFSTQEFQL